MSRQSLDTLKNRANAEQRWHRGTKRAADAREEYQRARFEQRVRELVESAPELTPEQADRLAVLLRPAVKAAAAERSDQGAA